MSEENNKFLANVYMTEERRKVIMFQSQFTWKIKKFVKFQVIGKQKSEKLVKFICRRRVRSW